MTYVIGWHGHRPIRILFLEYNIVAKSIWLSHAEQLLRVTWQSVRFKFKLADNCRMMEVFDFWLGAIRTNWVKNGIVQREICVLNPQYVSALAKSGEIVSENVNSYDVSHGFSLVGCWISQSIYFIAIYLYILHTFDRFSFIFLPRISRLYITIIGEVSIIQIS